MPNIDTNTWFSRVAITKPAPYVTPVFNELRLIKSVNTIETTRKVTVSPNGDGTINLSCTLVCSGWVQLWSDDAGTKKSDVVYFSMPKAGWKPLTFHDIPYLSTKFGLTRIATQRPEAEPVPRFIDLELIKG